LFPILTCASVFPTTSWSCFKVPCLILRPVFDPLWVDFGAGWKTGI
jgi:hypothetical protein